MVDRRGAGSGGLWRVAAPGDDPRGYGSPPREMTASPGRPRDQAVELVGVNPAVRRAVDLNGRAERAVAEAEDVVQVGPVRAAARGLAEADTEPVAGVRGQCLRADGLAGLSPANPDVCPGGRVPEVAVERHHPVHVGAGEVEPRGQQ